ncbi:MAG: phasin family protein [Candidatus Dormibacteraeota bacterium]|nr:phasin family protein [Candidatus Dormibacteraeota bacterium]
MGSDKHLIKKYANRKLYDTRTSRYITIDGISELVRQGHDIEVVERDSGRDLTPLILSQIVMGEEKRGDLSGRDHLQERGQTLLGYVRRTLTAPAAMVSSEMERRRTEFEELSEMAVENALARLSIPTRRDLDALSARIDDLQRRLDRALGATGRRGTGAAATRTRTVSQRQ